MFLFYHHFFSRSLNGQNWMDPESFKAQIRIRNGSRHKRVRLGSWDESRSAQSMNPDRHNVKRNFKSGDVYYYEVET